MKIVVTGASSMLGIALISECILNNVEVLAIVREYSSKINRIPKSPLVNLVECNLENLKSLKDSISGQYDIFYHLAWAETSNMSRNNAEAHSLNIKYTLDAVEIAYKLRCKTFIGAGSQAEYGRKNFIIKSTTECNPETAYGISKFAAGKLSAIKCKSYGLKHIWVRIFSVYGPNNNNETMVMYCIRKLLAGERPRLTKCEQIWDYLYCDDAARVLFLLAEKGSDNKIYNIASGNAEHLSRYIKQIRDIIDSKLEIGIGEVEYSDHQVMFLSADISDLIKDTGFVPETTFKEGIEKTIHWIRSESV
jgi:UDP-glucose 4-epimerase